jgi:hypothetical protein
MKEQHPARDDYPHGDLDFLWEKGKKEMIGHKVMGLAVFFMLLFVIAAPVAAAEKTIQLNSPGCNA